MNDMNRPDQLELRGKKVSFGAISGVVVGDKKWSETHVTSSGGGGMVGRWGGYVSAPTINSFTNTKSEIWLRDAGGQEHPIHLTNVNIPVREGHHVTAVWGMRDGAAAAQYVLIENHTAQQHAVIEGCFPALAGHSSGKVGCLALIVVAFVIFILSVRANAAGLLWFVPAAAVAWGWWRAQRYKQDAEVLREHLEIVRAALARQQQPQPV